MQNQQTCGGLAPGLKQVTPEVIALANKHRADAQAHLGRNFATWQPVAFTTQIVAGQNFFIKVNTGSEHVHLKIWQQLNGETEFTEAHGGKNATEGFY